MDLRVCWCVGLVLRVALRVLRAGACLCRCCVLLLSAGLVLRADLVVRAGVWTSCRLCVDGVAWGSCRLAVSRVCTCADAAGGEGAGAGCPWPHPRVLPHLFPVLSVRPPRGQALARVQGAHPPRRPDTGWGRARPSMCPGSGGEQLRTPGHPCLHPRVPSLRLGHASLWSPRRAAREAHLLRRLAVSADVFIHASDDSWSAGPAVLSTQARKAGRPASQGRGDTVPAGQPLPPETCRPSVSLHCPRASWPASGPAPPACRFSHVLLLQRLLFPVPEPLFHRRQRLYL